MPVTVLSLRTSPSARSDPRLVAELCFALVEAALKQCFVHGQVERQEEYIREVVGAIRALTLVDPRHGS